MTAMPNNGLALISTINVIDSTQSKHEFLAGGSELKDC